MVGRGVEAVADVGWNLRLRLQVKAFDVTFEKLANEFTAGRIAIDDDDTL
jgi:hypothetical protein